MRNRSQSLPVRLSRYVGEAGLVLAAITAVSAAGAQELTGTYRFPSTNVQTGSGRVVTEVLTSHEIKAAYELWRSTLIRPCAGRGMRMIYPETDNDTRSEGIGYGMVIAAYMGDQPTFDGLWQFYQSHSNQGLMEWWISPNCNDVNDGGSASDADIDAAFGLIVADKQWGGYADDASGILQSIRTRLFNGQCGGILLGGTNIAQCGCVNPSYIPPGYYRAFADYDDATFWSGAINSTYTYLSTVQQDNTGLVPAWSTSAGGGNLSCNPIVSGGGGTDEFQADAARTPWRVAADLLWSGDERATAFLAPIAQFATSAPRRITNIVDRYELDGTPLQTEAAGGGPLDPVTLNADGRRSTFTIGGFATAMTASTQENIDRFTGAWQSLYAPGDSSGTYRAFGNSLALLYGLLVTGYMWDPIGAPPTAAEPPTLNEQVGNLLINGDFDEGVRGWTMENLGGIESEGFAMHQDGETHVLIQKAAVGDDLAYHLRLKQQVEIQANQNYRFTLSARAAAPRSLKAFVGQRDEPYTQYFSLDDPETEGDAINLTTEMQTFSVVVAGAATTGFVQLALDLGGNDAEVVIDDVSIVPTTDPVTEPGSPIVQQPAAPDPNNPGAGAPTATPGDGNLGTVDPVGDNSGAPGVGGPGAPTPGGEVGGAPPTPTGVPLVTTCSAQNVNACGAPYACSVRLGLCYDTATGYVYNPTTLQWTQPPPGPAGGCATDQVFWPLINSCYVPDTGWAFNEAAGQWQWYGIDYTSGKRPPADDGCAVSGVAAGSGSSSWGLLGLLGAALGLASRRRSAA